MKHWTEQFNDFLDDLTTPKRMTTQIESGYYSTDPIKNMVISDIMNAKTRSEYDKAIAHAKEEGLNEDENVLAWMDFREKLVFNPEN